MARPHRHDGWRRLWLAVWCTFRQPSLGRPVPRQCLRHAWLDVSPTVPITPCHQSKDVEPYRR